LPDSTEHSFTGRFRIEGGTTAPLTPNKAARFNRLVGSFIGAIGSGLFGPAVLRMGSMSDVLGDDQRTIVAQPFTVEHLPLGAFRILSGMLFWFNNQVAPFEWYAVRNVDDGQDLLKTTAAYPAPIHKLPFAVEQVRQGGVAPAVLIRIIFQQPPAAETREQFLQALKYWDDLLCGGFPVDDGPPGESGVGRSTTHFVSPTILEHSIDALFADSRCFDLILNMAGQWSSKTKIQQIEIDA